MTRFRILLTSLLLLPLFSQAGPGRNPVDVSNLLRVEYDDNVFNTGDNVNVEKQESFKITEQIELLLDGEQGPMTFGFLYSPSLAYYTDRPDDDTDLNHLLDASFGITSPKGFSFRVKDTFRRSEEPELIEDDVQFRKSNDFYYNSLNATLSTTLLPKRLDALVDARYILVRYDEGDVANAADYDQVTAATELVYTLGPDRQASAQVNYTSLDYENNFRNSDAVQVGLAYVQQVTPTTRADVRAGYEYRELDDAVEQDSDSPYIDLSVVTSPIANSALTLGAVYSLDKSPVNIFSQQERLRFYATGTYSISPAMRVSLSGSYSSGSFDTDDATSLFDPAEDTDGDETVLQFSAGVTYSINVRNSILATYQYTELDSDVRPLSNYDRNRVSLGWQYDL